MGDIVRLGGDGQVELEVEATGSAPIVQLDIFDGPDIIGTVRYGDRTAPSRRVRVTFSGAEYRGRSRNTTWDGHLTVQKNSIESATMFNNWNLDRGIREKTETSVIWKAVTTGNFCGFDLVLAQPDSGTLTIHSPHVRDTVDLAELGTDPCVFKAGGLERQLIIERLPEEFPHETIRYTLPITVGSDGDTRLYVRITQEDGHRAWSSPIYLFRE